MKYYLLYRLVKDWMKNQREKGRSGQRRRHFLLLIKYYLLHSLTCLREMNTVIRTQLMGEFFLATSIYIIR